MDIEKIIQNLLVKQKTLFMKTKLFKLEIVDGCVVYLKKVIRMSLMVK